MKAFRRLLAMWLLAAAVLTGGGSLPGWPVPAGTRAAAVSPALPDSPDLSPTPAPVRPFEVSATATALLVTELGRGMVLFSQNADVPMPLPLANRVMTALIAIEMFSLDTQVTISQEAAGADDQLNLEAGMKVRMEYLLLGMLLRDSDAAAIALAEQVSGEEPLFVQEMNTRASAFQMTMTTFSNATGNPADGQASTVGDLSRLLRYALANGTFRTLFRTRDTPYFFQDGSSRLLTNRFSSAWSLVDGTDGALRAGLPTGFQNSAITASSGGINLLSVVGDSREASSTADQGALVQGCFRAYEYALLVQAGQAWPVDEEVEGIPVEVRFNQNVFYVRPVGQSHVASTRYESLGPHTLPLLASNPVGRLVFTLQDGSTIIAELFPTRTIWDDNRLFARLIERFRQNQDLSMTLLVLSGLLVLLAVVQVGARMVRRRMAGRPQPLAETRTNPADVQVDQQGQGIVVHQQDSQGQQPGDRQG